MRLQQIFEMIDKSISYFGFVDLWLDVRITSEIVPKETIRVVVSNKVDFRKLERFNLQTFRERVSGVFLYLHIINLLII